MKIVWTIYASQDLDNIYSYIAKDSEVYAKRIIDRITQRSIDISDFPYSGKIVPEFENDRVREVIVKPYRIIYKIKDSQIDVLTVIHSMKNFKSP